MQPASDRSDALEDDDNLAVAVTIDSKCMGRWAQGTSQYINYELYKYIQFVNRDEDIRYGSDVQQLVCDHLEIPDVDGRRFWNNVGERTTIEALKRKQQTIGNAFRKRFESKWVQKLTHEKLINLTDSCRVKYRNGAEGENHTTQPSGHVGRSDRIK